MMPLTFAQAGQVVEVLKVGGKESVKKHLGDLGFVEGAQVSVVSSHDGDMIINVKDSKLAITREMASRVMIK